MAPSIPTATIVDVTAYTITINWRVSELTYGQENYTVLLGMTADAININAGTVVSTADLAATNQLYSLTISSLNPGTQYYFTVMSTNSITSSESVVLSSQTRIPGIII